jgi:methionyl-tRNA synthetase
MSNSFYITTPIYYVNDIPHIGHAYTTILADVLSRHQKQVGNKPFFLTGLDEHGQKVQDAAKNRGIETQTHCNEMSKRFISLWERLHISNDDFIRTTEIRHKNVVKKILKTVFDAGDIYEDEYQGLYSVSEERFITEKEADTGQFRDIKTLKEKNYFFRMSKYQDRLINHIETNPNFIQPDHRRNEVLGFLNQPLNDLCISRPKSRLNWGIELPFDSDYVTYVWFDALINYITAPGYIDDKSSFEKFWPADLHLIGKDILTTHAVYWPTMLMSADIELPKMIFAHGWWLMDKEKMSKSSGNVINPMDLIDDYGVDPVRYYLMREMILGQDANFTVKSFINRYNSDLANDLGNLLSRISTLIKKNYNGQIPDGCSSGNKEQEIKDESIELVKKFDKYMSSLSINEAIEELLQFVRRINRYFEHKAPWKLVKEDLKSAGTVLYTGAEALRICAILLSPVMPKRMKLLLSILNAESSDRTWGSLEPGKLMGEHKPLFPRISSENIQ